MQSYRDIKHKYLPCNLLSGESMSEQEQRTTEVLERTTQIKIIKLYAELRIYSTGFFSCLIGTIGTAWK
jgi:hypothetical protein